MINDEKIERFEKAVRANGYRTTTDATELEFRVAKADLVAAFVSDAERHDSAIPDGWQLVPMQPTKEMAYKAACAHYGVGRVNAVGGIDGLSMTVDSVDYNFWRAFRKFWKGALSVSPAAPPPPTAEEPVTTQNYHIVFDGFLSPDGPRFIEVENDDGKSLQAGTWRKRPDGLCELVLPIVAWEPADGGCLKGVRAMSASIDSPRILQLHFDHDVSDADRARLVALHNAAVQSPPPPVAGTDLLVIYWEWTEDTPYAGSKFWGCHSVESDGRIRDWPKMGMRPRAASKVTVVDGVGLELLSKEGL